MALIPKQEDVRDTRGGCWDFGTRVCRSSYRNPVYRRYASDYYGFRVFMSKINEEN